MAGEEMADDAGAVPEQQSIALVMEEGSDWPLFYADFLQVVEVPGGVKVLAGQIHPTEPKKIQRAIALVMTTDLWKGSILKISEIRESLEIYPPRSVPEDLTWPDAIDSYVCATLSAAISVSGESLDVYRASARDFFLAIQRSEHRVEARQAIRIEMLHGGLRTLLPTNATS